MIRRARLDERDRLREIAVVAKAHWGYPFEQVDGWAAELDFSAAGQELYVAELDGQVVAFMSLIPRGEVCVLEDLWVVPAAMGQGVGTKLFRLGAERAGELGAQTMEWEAEPNAVGFYERMGGRHVRDSEPSEWGRILPVMALTLPG